MNCSCLYACGKRVKVEVTLEGMERKRVMKQCDSKAYGVEGGERAVVGVCGEAPLVTGGREEYA